MPTATGSGPAGSRRFWATVLCFAVANLGIWFGYDRLQQHRRHALLEVRQSAPVAGSEVHGRPTFWWTFNLDVAPAKPTDPPPGTISPTVPGKWVWDGPRALTFTPDAQLPKATPFTVTLLADRLQTPDGFRLKSPIVTAVHTEPLQVRGVSQAAFDERDRLVIEIAFNDDVTPADVLSHLSLKDFNGRSIGFHLHGQAAGRVVRVLTDPVPQPPREHHPCVIVQLTPGLAGRSGPLALSDLYTGSVTIGSALAATGARVYYAWGADAPQISLTFNNPIDRQFIEPLISIDPKVAYTLTSDGENSLELHGDFQPATRYAIKIANAADATNLRKAPRPDTLSVYVPDRSPSIRFEHQEGYLGSAGNRTILAHAVNVTAVRATISRIYDNNLVVWRNTQTDANVLDRPLATKDIKLPAIKNKTQDVRFSLDDLLPADAPRDGVYLVQVQRLANIDTGADDQERYTDSAMVTLSDIGLTAKQGRTAITVWATSLRTAEPLAGVRVRLFSSKNQRLGHATTGADGIATIPIAPLPEGEVASVILADRPNSPSDSAPQDAAASAGRDLTWLDLHNSKVDFGEADIAGDAYLRTGHEAFIYSDRGVYRPGESVHLRAIVRGPDGVTPKSFPVRWQFRRPDLHDWRSVVGQLDADGAISLDLPLPDDLPTGRWSVALGLPGNDKQSESFGSATFQVEDFMPNRMQVGLTLKQNADGNQTPRLMMTDEPLSAEVQADYLFGKPVSQRPAKLVARIDPVPFSPPQWRGWIFGDSATVEQTLNNLKVTGHRTELPEQALDARGHAAFDIDLGALLTGDDTQPAHPATHRRGRHDPASAAQQAPPNAGARYVGPWRLTVVASVLETGGRAVSATREAELDPTPWYIALRPRAASQSPGVSNSFDVALVSTPGQAASDDATLEAEVYKETWNNSLAYEKGQYVYHSTRLLESVQQKHAIHIAAGKGSIDLQLDNFGSYVLCVRDPKTGGMTSISFYSGQGAWEDNISRENPEKLELLVEPQPRSVQVGEALHELAAGLKTEIGVLVARASRPWLGVSTGETPVPQEQSIIVPELNEAVLKLHRVLQLSKTGGNKRILRVGDTAQVIVRSPFAGRLLLSVETDDVVTTRVIDMPANHVSVPIVISSACRPNAYITASVVRAIDPDAAWQTHRAIGTIRVPIDNEDRKLAVEIAAPEVIRPATSLGADVRVVDSSGNPVANAAVTVAAVDEGICQLTGFQTPDPFGFFTRIRALAVGTADLYSQLMPEVPKAEKVSTVGGDKDAYDPRHLSPVSAKRVKPVALVSGVLHTDSNGLAHADFSVARFTGKLRLMVVASEGPRFGSAETPTLVRSPLLVQSSWPRFAAPGDQFEVPLTLFNNTPAQVEARVRLHVSDGPLRFGQSADARIASIKLPPNGQATQIVEVTAAADCGVSHIVLVASTGGESYEEDVEIPVRPASPEIHIGGYAVATPNQPAEIIMPGGMLKGTQRFELRATPWPSLQLPQGLDYLERYPYGCLEQTASTLFPLVYLSDIGQQISPGMFEKNRIDDKVHAGITRLIGMQTASGGLAMWPGYSEPWPWGTVYAAHFLIEADNAGHPVPVAFRRSVLGYVRGLLNSSSDDPETLETQAYACHVLALAGRPERAIMSRLGEVLSAPRPDGASVSFQARLHLASAWLAAGRRDLAEGLIPQVLPMPREKRSLSGSLGSPVRDRAILIDTLLAVQPDHPALPALVQQLANSGRAGQWRSTQDTAFAVLALGRYLRQNRNVAAYETAVLKRDASILCQAASGQPLAWDVGSGTQGRDSSNLRLEITGPVGAKAHVAWLQSGVPLKPQPAEDHGMKIRRRLLNERGKPLASNRVRSGDLMQVELSISSQTPLEYVAIDDLLPAGLEIENPRLLTTAADATEQPRDVAPINLFHDTRTDMRDDRLIVIGDLTSAGTGTYVYTARAVTPGKFVLPPVHAECMYDIGTSSLSEQGTFEVMSIRSERIANVRDDAGDR